MAIYHFSMQSISRGTGRSLVAALAYRMCGRLTDDRTGLVHDYRRKGGHAAGGMVGWDETPNAWADAAEAAEKHPRAQIAREIVLALPVELDIARQAEVVQSYAQWLRTRHGMAIRWDIHRPSPNAGHGDNPHAHLLLTTRKIDDNRFGGKTRELDVKGTAALHVRAWRQSWADHVNQALRDAGLTVQIDARSLRDKAKAEGALLAPEPMEHLGPAKSALERRGKRTDRGDDNRRRRRRNQERDRLNAEWKTNARHLANLERRKRHRQAVAAVMEFHRVSAIAPEPMRNRRNAFIDMVNAAQQAWPGRWLRPLLWLLRKTWPEGSRVAARVGVFLSGAGLLPHLYRQVGSLLTIAIETDPPQQRQRER